MSRHITAWQRDLRRKSAGADFARVAERLREQGSLAEATWVCARGIANNPHYATGHTVLGEILYDAGLKNRAKEEFSLAVDLEGMNTRARLGLAKALLEERKVQGALDHLDFVLFWQPQHGEARNLLEKAGILQRDQQVNALLGPPLEAGAVSETKSAEGASGRAELAAPAPPGLRPGRESELCSLLVECGSVSGAMIINSEGLVVASEAALQEAEDEAAASLAAIAETSNSYLLRLGLDYLEGGLIEGEDCTLRIFRYQDYVLVVLLQEEAKLGPAEVEISNAIERLDRRRKMRVTDTFSEELAAEKKDA